MNQFKTSAVVVATMMLSGAALAQSGGSMPGMNMPDHGAMKDMPMQSAQPITGSGVVKKVDAAKRTVNLSHGPIAAIGWPAMTMDFAVAPAVDLASVQAGQSVDFTLEPSGPGRYTVTGISPAKK